MASSLVTCTYCTKNFLKDNRHINENIKLGNNFYCSSECQYSFKNKKVELGCENPACTNKFKRAQNEISLHNYCSRSCAVAINNARFPKRRKILLSGKYCRHCGISISGRRNYCSMICQPQSQCIVSKEYIINQIQNFYVKNKRIPLKREFNHYSAARKRFGNWNNAIKTAGFKPNPVLFAEHQIANDGHVCDSIAEKIIDDYLSEKSIVHERNISYPEGDYSVDFRIGLKWVEYFGLAGEHKRYDELRKIKLELAEKYKLSLVEIYPKDLYPYNRLEAIFGS